MNAISLRRIAGFLFFGGVLTTLLISWLQSDALAVVKLENPPPNIVFLIADDWSYPHASVYGDPVVRTPTFDFLAHEGVLFDQAYCASPSCSPSRASILLGQYPHEIESAGNLWSVIPDKFPNWMTLLQQAGYHTGKSRKGWGPGDYEAGGYQENPAGKDYPDFEAFLKSKKKGTPFAYWFGSNDPHRAYEANLGAKTGMDASKIIVPDPFPDTPCVRNDMLDYYFEVERFDRECGAILQRLENEGLLENTIVVMTSDNGMPFPRAKANLYDLGTRMPLAIYWKGNMEGGKHSSDFVNFVDFAPTFLEAAGLSIPKEFSGKSLLPLLRRGKEQGTERKRVFLERERHANVRKGDLSYPARALRTKDFLYIKNFEPDRWPAGEPQVHQSVGQYGDVDNSITKFLIMARENQPVERDYFKLAFGKRPSEELYEVTLDPYQINNLAEKVEYQEILLKMREELQVWMLATNDLRAKEPNTDYWDKVLYTPDYQRHNVDLQKELASYRMLQKNGGAFKELQCETP